MNSCVQFGKAQEFSPVESSSVWEVDDTPDTETLICDVKQEVETDEDSPLWASPDSAAAPEKSISTLQSKVTLTDILRGVKVREDTLQSAVARLGGGTRGLQMLLKHVNHWAVKSEDEEDVMVTIRREIVRLSMLPTPQRHHNSEISTTSGDGNGFDAKGNPRGEIVNRGAAYTRALRKSYMVRQRVQTRVQQRHHLTRIKSENQSQQCQLSTSDDRRKQAGMEFEFSNGNDTGYDFLFQKVLRASDVSSLGRIVLPKGWNPTSFPGLPLRETLDSPVQMRYGIEFIGIDVNAVDFIGRLRFWPNNKSRMYLLENIGNFVTFHHLQDGDLLLCYRNYQGGYVLRGEKFQQNAKTPAVKGLCSEGAKASPTTGMKTVSTVIPATHQLVEGEMPSETHSANLANSSSDSLNCTLGETDDASPTSSEMETFTAVMLATHELVEGETPLSTDLANSYSDLLNCASGETGDAKYCQDGDSGQDQGCFSQQSGSPPCSGDVRTDSPASCEPLVHDEDPGVTMLYVSNVRQLYLDEDQFMVECTTSSA